MNWDMGLFVGGVIALGGGIWKITTWVGPRIDRLISAHLSLLTKLEENLAKNTEILQRLEERLDQHDKNVHERLIKHALPT